jgi:ABC-type Fe3+/spermidine/putrescine transport system ATPase subunit
MAKVELLNLSKNYPGRKTPVLDQFSLTVDSGELVSLLGPSGSGKSTLLRLITGIEYPDSGDILFDGKSILSIPPNKRGAVLMFQKAYLFPFLSVEENIGFGLKVQGATKQTIQIEVAKILDLIGLPGIERRKPAHLSGGEQQRVALARALIVRPTLLLLDEPLSSLDTAVRQNLQEAIRRIQHELGITAILVTHDLGEAMGMSDRMALLLEGKVAAIDEPMKLFQKPPSSQVAKFVGIDTFLKGRVNHGTLETQHGNLTVRTNGFVSDSATFAIRPEHIEVGSELAENILTGVVKDCMYRGEYVEYQIQIDTMVVRARVAMPAAMIPHGEVIKVAFPAEHLFPLTA